MSLLTHISAMASGECPPFEEANTRGELMLNVAD
jgi:hypothetical protein